MQSVEFKAIMYYLVMSNLLNFMARSLLLKLQELLNKFLKVTSTTFGDVSTIDKTWSCYKLQSFHFSHVHSFFTRVFVKCIGRKLSL